MIIGISGIKIYTLSHPITGEIRYVGKSNDPDRRYRHHLVSSTNEKSNKRSWINELIAIGLRPTLEVIEEVDSDEALTIERYWIEQFTAWGFSLTNTREDNKFGNTTSFRKNSTPWNKTSNGYKLTGEKTAIPVLKFSLDNIFIQEYSSYSEAAKEHNCIPENIRRACVGLSKTAVRFIWKYKTD